MNTAEQKRDMVQKMHDLFKKNRDCPIDEIITLLESSDVKFDPEVTFGGLPENLPVCLAARAHRVDVLKMLIDKYHADSRFHFCMTMLPAVSSMDLVPCSSVCNICFHDFVILACCDNFDLCQEMLAVVSEDLRIESCPENLLLQITQVACNLLDPKVLRVFLNRLEKLPTDCDGRTSLHHAAMRCGASTDPHAPIIQMLHELAKVRSSINSFDDYGLTALQYACRAGSLAAVRVLIAAGASVDHYWGHDSCTALHLAVASQSIEVVHELLRAGARTTTEVLCDYVADQPMTINGDPADVARAAGNFRLARYVSDPLRSSLGVLLESSTGDDVDSALMFEPVPGEEVDGTCMICMEETKLIPLGRCHHAFCKDCLAQWFNTNSDGVTRPRCPHSNCNLPVSVYDIQAVLGKSAADRMNQLLLQRTLAEMPDFRWCPRCSNGGFFTGVCHSAQCDSCGYKFCTECQQEAHEGMSCAQKTFQMVDNKVGSAKWISQNTKPCPACHVPICKNGGCSHMRCTRCNYEFCWYCLGKYQGVYTFEPRCPCPKRANH